MASAPVVVSPRFEPLLPDQPRRFLTAEMLFLAFVLVQVLDGALSYIGVSLHGPEIEGNPLVAWYLATLGPAVGFTAAKVFAILCGSVLYITARHRWVAMLTIVYILFAVGPWASLLGTTL